MCFCTDQRPKPLRRRAPFVSAEDDPGAAPLNYPPPLPNVIQMSARFLFSPCHRRDRSPGVSNIYCLLLRAGYKHVELIPKKKKKKGGLSWKLECSFPIILLWNLTSHHENVTHRIGGCIKKVVQHIFLDVYICFYSLIPNAVAVDASESKVCTGTVPSLLLGSC